MCVQKITRVLIYYFLSLFKSAGLQIFTCKKSPNNRAICVLKVSTLESLKEIEKRWIFSRTIAYKFQLLSSKLEVLKSHLHTLAKQ